MSNIVELQFHQSQSRASASPSAARRARLIVAVLFAAAATTSASNAQNVSRVDGPPVSPKIEIFAGYSYLYPNATASGYLPNGIVPVSSCLCALADGGGSSVSVAFNKWINVTIDGSAHVGGKSGSNASRIGNADAYNLAVGPQFKLRHKHFEPFAEVLFGGDRLAPSAFHQDTGFGMLAGGGLDIPVNRIIAIRAVQADFVYANHHFGAAPVTNVRGMRLQAGVVFRFGGHAAPVAPPAAPIAAAPALAAAPMPAAAAPVDQVTLTANALPADMLVGATSTIEAQGNSSLGRPLTYNFSTSLGAIQGNGATAILSTAGVGAGTAIVTVNALDDQGQAASVNVPVVLHAVPVAAVATTMPLCTLTFDRDLRRPSRVNNEGKACLDDIAMTLGRNSDARLALIGSVATSGPHADSRRQRLAAKRAEHARDYLVQEKGIDPARIDVYTEERNSKSVNTVLIPAGATLDQTGLTQVSSH